MYNDFDICFNYTINTKDLREVFNTYLLTRCLLQYQEKRASDKIRILLGIKVKCNCCTKVDFLRRRNSFNFKIPQKYYNL